LVEANAFPIISSSRVRVRMNRSLRCSRTFVLARIFSFSTVMNVADSPET